MHVYVKKDPAPPVSHPAYLRTKCTAVFLFFSSVYMYKTVGKLLTHLPTEEIVCVSF